MVAGGQRPGRVVQACRALLGIAGVELRAEGLDLGPKPVLAADVVPQHVQQHAAAPELLAVHQLVDHRRPVAGIVGADHDEQAHAQTDQPPRHPVQHDHGDGQYPPESFDGKSHVGTRESKSCAGS